MLAVYSSGFLTGFVAVTSSCLLGKLSNKPLPLFLMRVESGVLWDAFLEVPAADSPLGSAAARK